MYQGDFEKSGTIYIYFNTVGTTGEAASLSSGVITAYENGSSTQFTSGISLTANFDSVTGFHQVALDLTDANFEVGKTYTLILSAGTVGSLSVIGRIVGSLSVGRYASADDVIGTALSEPTGVPAANASLGEKVSWIFAYFRNKVEVTSSSRVLKADNGTTTIATETLSDAAGTTTKSEAV